MAHTLTSRLINVESCVNMAVCTVFCHTYNMVDKWGPTSPSCTAATHHVIAGREDAHDANQRKPCGHLGCSLSGEPRFFIQACLFLLVSKNAWNQKHFLHRFSKCTFAGSQHIDKLKTQSDVKSSAAGCPDSTSMPGSSLQWILTPLICPVQLKGLEQFNLFLPLAYRFFSLLHFNGSYDGRGHCGTQLTWIYKQRASINVTTGHSRLCKPFCERLGGKQKEKHFRIRKNKIWFWFSPFSINVVKQTWPVYVTVIYNNLQQRHYYFCYYYLIII